MCLENNLEILSGFWLAKPHHPLALKCGASVIRAGVGPATTESQFSVAIWQGVEESSSLRASPCGVEYSHPHAT